MAHYITKTKKTVIAVAIHLFPICQKIQNFNFGQNKSWYPVYRTKKDNLNWFFASGADDHCSMILWNPSKAQNSNSKQTERNVDEESEFVAQHSPTHGQRYQSTFELVWLSHFKPLYIHPSLNAFRFSFFHPFEDARKWKRSSNRIEVEPKYLVVDKRDGGRVLWRGYQKAFAMIAPIFARYLSPARNEKATVWKN